MEKIDVSIILPCYNQAAYLESSVKEIMNVFSYTKYSYEIIIAEDGSTDSSYVIAKKLEKKYKNVRLIHEKKKLGFGLAVSNAIRKSNGEIAGFVATDLSTSAHYLPLIISQFKKGYDIVTAKRNYKYDTKNIFKKFTSILMHNGYILLFRLLIKTNLKDTETDCKFFKRKKILPILDEIKAKHWFWDTEVMVRPYFKGYKIKEVPILYIQKYNNKTTVNPLRDSIDQFIRLIKLRSEIKKIKK